MGLGRRVGKLEERLRPDRASEPPWTPEGRAGAALEKLRIDLCTANPARPNLYTDAEIKALLLALDAGGVEDLPERVRPHVGRMPADMQLEHEWAWFRHWQNRHEERERRERERKRLEEERLRGNLQHLEMLRRAGLYWEHSRAAHEAFRERLLEELEGLG